MVCRNCGYQNPHGSVFCSGCGRKLVDVNDTHPSRKSKLNILYLAAASLLFVVLLVALLPGRNKEVYHPTGEASVIQPNTSPTPTSKPIADPDSVAGSSFVVQSTQPTTTPKDGTYYYSTAYYPYYDGTHFYVNLRGSSEDLYTSLKNSGGEAKTGIAGISYQFAYDLSEYYFVEYIESIESHPDGTYSIYTYSPYDFSARELRIESDGHDGYISEYEGENFAGFGFAPKVFWMEPVSLEIASDCVFLDERMINGHAQVRLTLEEMMDTISYVDSANCGNIPLVDVTVTVKNGKVTELILPFMP